MRIKNKNIMFQQCDITRSTSVKKAIQGISKKFKRIDALVNSAYPRNKNYGRKFEDVTYEDFCENLNSHLGGYFLMAKETAKIMKKQTKLQNAQQELKEAKSQLS